jgi:putative transposase
MKTTSNPYSGHRYPTVIISHAVCLYFRFALSYRGVEEILAARGIVVSYETIRRWCVKFGQQYANRIRQRRGDLGDTWQLDEVFVTINGQRLYLWRAVDQDGDVLDILVQKHRDRKAAKRFFLKLMKGMCYSPRAIVTDNLRSYGVSKKEIMPGVMYWQGKWENNRAEISHQPTWQRERQMRRFNSNRRVTHNGFSPPKARSITCFV